MHRVAFEEAYPPARELARQKALQVIGRCGLTPEDCDDVASQLLLTFYARFDRYDSNRGSIRTFASRLMDKELNSILRYRLAGRRRHLGEGLVSEDIAALETAPLSSDPAALTLADRQNFWLDFERVMDQLPDVLRETALALCWYTPTELSRLPGHSRTIIYRRIRRLREALAAAGIGPDYFAGAGGGQ